MAENFLAQLAQSGALNIPNPMASYEKAFALMKFQREEKSAQLGDEAKLMTMFQHTLKGAQTRADYGRAYNYYSKKFPGLMEGAGVPSPDSFTDEKSYQYWNIATTEGISAAIKAQKGEKFPITIKLPNGEVRTEEVYDEDLQKGLASGLYDPKTTFRGKLDKESYAAITERATATEAGKKPETEMVTIYGPLGETQRVPVTKGEVYEPPAGFSLTKPEKPQVFSPGQGYVDPTGKTVIPVPVTEKMDRANLTARALQGDAEAQNILKDIEASDIRVAKAKGEATTSGKMEAIDIESTARAITEGRETIDNVRNAFGMPVQQAVRQRVLEIEPNFNFNIPRAQAAAIKGSLALQEKTRGMMGGFTRTIDKQVIRTEEIMEDITNRVGLRALDLPIRKLNRGLKGSGHENVIEAYMLEISNEIGKISTGSSASIRELSTQAQERWAKIHDPNLSFRELDKILKETRLMANLRLQSTDEEIQATRRLFEDINAPRPEEAPKATAPSGKPRFKILKVE